MTAVAMSVTCSTEPAAISVPSAPEGPPEPTRLADRIHKTVTTDDDGGHDQLVEVILPALRRPPWR
jgi:hypothetical protein